MATIYQPSFPKFISLNDFGIHAFRRNAKGSRFSTVTLSSACLGLGLVDVKDFQNVRNLVLSIHLIGETSEQQTRLFEKNILSKELKDEFPLDLNVTLKVRIFFSLLN